MAEQPVPLRAWLILGTALLAVSSAGAVFEMMDGPGPLLKAGWRLQATALVLLPGFMIQWKSADEEMKKQYKSSKVMWILFGSGICLTIHFGSWVWSLDETTLTHSLLFVTAHPLVIIVGLWILGRSASRNEAIGAIVGFTGAAIAIMGAGSEAGVTVFGDLFTLLFIVVVMLRMDSDLVPALLACAKGEGLAEVPLGYPEVEKSIEESAAEQAARLFRKIEYLSVIGTIAPMLGLLGTVWGMIIAFQEFASKVNPPVSELAPGIYQALVTTLLGLGVAVPALAAFAIFRNRIDELVAESSRMAEHAWAEFKRANLGRSSGQTRRKREPASPSTERQQERRVPPVAIERPEDPPA